MPKVLQKRERTILYLTSGVILFGIAFNLAIAPVLDRFATLNKEINYSRVKLSKYILLLKQKDKIMQKHGKIASELKAAGAGEGKAGGILQELERLAKEAEIKIVDIRPEAESTVAIRTEATMENYLKFIYSVENSLLLLKINKLQFATKPNITGLEGTFLIARLATKE